mmetsp:Transcript_28118/g.51551  ORF Transcript_28118/g.51551 Transcript_28118/m.51551 type:complete len:81 (-) Transcript_28118:34-276(-)
MGMPFMMQQGQFQLGSNHHRKQGYEEYIDQPIERKAKNQPSQCYCTSSSPCVAQHELRSKSTNVEKDRRNIQISIPQAIS